VADYRFVTEWDIDAPIARVWEQIEQPENWAGWWPGLEQVREIEPGDEVGAGALKELEFRSFLPYSLSFRGRMTDVVPPRLLRIEAAGELDGTGTYELSESGDGTSASFTWEVRTNKTWMNVLAPVAAPLFTWNHDRLMKAGGEGLGRRLGANVTLREVSGPSLPRALTRVLLVAAPVAWLLIRRARRK
jgi:uncharacterized protein YndB with AHSA1/START domain